MVFMMMYVATIMPYNLAFQDSEIKTNWYYIDLIIDFTFLSDCFLNCFSAFYDDEAKLVKNNKKIFTNYVRGWFVIDAIASFPFNLVEHDLEKKVSSGASYNKMLRLLRLPRLYRLLKIARLFKLISFVKKNPLLLKI